MYITLLLFGPTLMIFLGLQVMSSVPLTFTLFYGWLLCVPFLERTLKKNETFCSATSYMGFKQNSQSLKVGIWSGIIAFISIFGGLAWLQRYVIDVDDLLVLLKEWGFTGNIVLWLILILVVINPILEELYWRGFMHQKLSSRFNTYVVFLLTTTFYSLYHLLSVIPMFEWPWNVFSVIPVFLAGLFWSYMRQKWNTIIGGIVSHVLADLGIIFVYLFFVA
ncbi:CPBP family intramembrane glutamic endopeptidase [Pontibacillus marinus]|uniref:Metallopeptidase n=1 Tax=Pontibacillus marinus BH030004 = DSM 16465 TaxID=1385511 RepID=A0A0A5G1K4_9BACI|nr:CPBP family intramembrane glutamic endopeptidase [Pontibacillus marinus]KGX85929.1 metallopeptidase [Pontibacillus marinus BH030004 = DSM 16465]